MTTCDLTVVNGKGSTDSGRQDGEIGQSVYPFGPGTVHVTEPGRYRVPRAVVCVLREVGSGRRVSHVPSLDPHALREFSGF